ncbi:hypothetical protein PV390_29185 [Streptomyces sp. ME02-6991-2A]|uniref:hypothetical protein n=1 Tax=Streptomyces sp. ME02-6991-2A TaxID=3028677 RepID=UPI0010082978|nr:hypothetical protein [Streptomyces sp. ME02-6991-2A]MDX3378475.1 hypothetical protein [Streptomyces sp. ME02-6991-2A]
MSDPLDPVLKGADVDAQLLRRAQLEAVGRTVSGLDPDEFIDAATRVCALSWDDERARPPGYFEIHGQNWWIDTSRTEDRRGLLHAVTAAALVDAAGLPRSTAWVARVLTGVLTVRSISGNASTGLCFVLERHDASPLPDHVAHDVHPGDYAEFAIAVATAAEVLPLSVGGSIRFTGPPRPAP